MKLRYVVIFVSFLYSQLRPMQPKRTAYALTSIIQFVPQTGRDMEIHVSSDALKGKIPVRLI